MNGPGPGPRPKICAGPGPGSGPGANFGLGQARAHSFDMKCLSIIFNFLNRKGPHTKPPCVKPPFNNNRKFRKVVHLQYVELHPHTCCKQIHRSCTVWSPGIFKTFNFQMENFVHGFTHFHIEFDVQTPRCI